MPYNTPLKCTYPGTFIQIPLKVVGHFFEKTKKTKQILKSRNSKIGNPNKVEKACVVVEFDVVFLTFITPLRVSIRNVPSDGAILSSIHSKNLKNQKLKTYKSKNACL